MAQSSSQSNQAAIYVISVAAELAGVHPQTLRVYERKGLVRPTRTAGNTRRYSERDIVLLRKIQQLTNEGVNLAGVIRILELEEEIERLREGHERAVRELEESTRELKEMAGARDKMALVPLKEIRRIRRVLKSDVLDEAARRRTIPAPPAG
jgi:MerR family transcriptional regulator/heat shock protein HspR